MEKPILRFLNKQKLIIIGASGHGKVVADIAIRNGYKDIIFLDDNESIKECAGFPVVGRVSKAFDMEDKKIVAIGNAKIRQRIQNEISNVITLIHPNAVISRRVQIGKGTVVMGGTVINSDVIIGNGCIINTGSTIDHDCEISDFVHVSVGAHLAGTCKIRESTWIGAGATIINNIEIVQNTIVGAGAVVVSDITESGIYIGIPAKMKTGIKEGEK